MSKIICIIAMVLMWTSCGNSSSSGASGASEALAADSVRAQGSNASKSMFDADSAWHYVKRQVDFGPRVPGTEAHDAAARWLAAELRSRGATVVEQKMTLPGWNGKNIAACNIFAQFNPSASDRTLLLAHYDTRPWADNDPDPAMHTKPLDGANDGASGVGVLLEIARCIQLSGTDKGIDILFVDAEDYGSDGNEDSWALGSAWFAKNPPIGGYHPSRAILLDMVGGKGAQFPAEYFSRQYAAGLDDSLRAAAQRAGYADRFPMEMGTAVTDDHLPLNEAGIPAIDIIDYRPDSGFCPTWHTMADNLDNIDPESLRAVGETVVEFLRIND